MREANKAILSAQSMGASFNSNPILLDQDLGYAIQLVWTGTAEVGTFKLQASIDVGRINPDGIVSELNNWTDVASSSVAVSADGDFMWNADAIYYKWVRVVYVRTSGTGIVSGRVNVKGF